MARLGTRGPSSRGATLKFRVGHGPAAAVNKLENTRFFIAPVESYKLITKNTICSPPGMQRPLLETVVAR